MIYVFDDPSGELLAKSDLEPWLDKALLSRRGGGEGMMRRRRTTRRSACLPAPRSSGWCPPRAVSRPLEAYPGSPDALQMMTVPWSAPTIRQRTPRGTLRQGPGRSRGGFTTRIHPSVNSAGLPMRSDYRGFDLVIDDNLPEPSSVSDRQAGRKLHRGRQ